jgi:hypothetical protein
LVKRSFKTPLQAIVASLEGENTQRPLAFIPAGFLPKMLILEKDPVLGYRRKSQIQNTTIELVTFPDGHMSHIENQEQLADELVF